jgi:hypothetical protein
MGLKIKKNYVKNVQVNYLLQNTKSKIAIEAKSRISHHFFKRKSKIANENWKKKQGILEQLRNLWYDDSFYYFKSDDELKDDFQIPHRIVKMTHMDPAKQLTTIPCENQDQNDQNDQNDGIPASVSGFIHRNICPSRSRALLLTTVDK